MNPDRMGEGTDLLKINWLTRIQFMLVEPLSKVSSRFQMVLEPGVRTKLQNDSVRTLRIAETET